MKVTFTNSAEFKKALVTCARAAASKSTVPALECLKITATADNKVIITGYDLVTGITTTLCDYITVQEPGEILTNAKTFVSLAKKLPSTKTIVIETIDDKSIKVSKPGMEFNLPTVDVKTYPNLPSLESAKSFTVPFGDMKESIEQTLFAAGDNDEASLAKGCAFSLEVEKGEMKAFALDGFRVACRKTKIADDSVSFKAKLPKNVLLELAKSNTGDDENVIVSYDKRNIIFDINNSRVMGRLYGGNIFDVDALTAKITKDNTVTFNVNTSEFQEAVDSLVPLCTATEKTIVVKFTKNEIEFSIATALGTAKVSVEAKSNAETELVMGFNINYLLEAVEAVESEDFEMTVGNAYNPINILDGKANFITLPVRIKTAA